MIKLNKSFVRRIFPKRPNTAHKGDLGRIYIVAGSRGMVGAGILVSKAAIFSGAGLVRFGVVASEQKTAARRAPLEIVTQGLPHDLSGRFSLKAWPVILKSIQMFEPDVIAFGPGVGQSGDINKLTFNLLKKNSAALVIDADGLNSLSHLKSLKRKEPWIITPHPGEMSRLLKVSIKEIEADRVLMVKKAAQKFNAVCVLKGHKTLVSDGQKVFENTTGNAGMASGGTGDVLTGVIAALWGQFKIQSKETALQAAIIGVFAHGAAGDASKRKKGKTSLIASDIIDALPFVFKGIEK